MTRGRRKCVHALLLMFCFVCRECFHVEVSNEERGEVVVDVSVIKGGLLDILIDVYGQCRIFFFFFLSF